MNYKEPRISLMDAKASGPVLDISEPEHGVEILVKADGKVLWVNVDGINRLRISHMPKLKINDQRTKQVRCRQEGTERP